METVSISGASFTADEKQLLFSSNRTGIFNVDAVPVAGGAAAPLTESAVDSTFVVSAFPFDDRFLYTRDQGGNEKNHLYVKTPGGKEQDLTPGEKLKAIFAGWTHDGDAASTSRPTSATSATSTSTSTTRRPTRASSCTRTTTGYDLGAISDDGKWLAFQKANSTADSDMYLWSAATKQMQLLSKHEGVATYDPATFDPASRWLYYLTNDGGGVHARAALGARDRQDRGRREGRLGRRVDVLLPGRQVPRLGGQSGRAHGAEGLGRQDRRRRPAAGIPFRRDLLGAHFAQRERGSRSSSTATAARTTSTCTSSARRPRSG